ncbi:MAG: site-2 protease family protein [Planctomycetota bacterium]|nr:site-2 protease family protein [Planctomycetota bacterium]
MILSGPLGTILDLLLVVLGFGGIIFVHELGHFLAARWAGIRVLAFALGFGPAIVSYRQGLGTRRGSSEREYLTLLAQGRAQGICPTEYRWNVLPLGGYVKMLGQEDANPNAVSDAPDSYQRCKPWKRMVVISAGVIMNLITAALLFIIVFQIGLKTEPAKIGVVLSDMPGARAIAENADEAGVREAGLQPGDMVLEINGDRPNSFNDIELATTMAGRGETIDLLVRRPGIDDPLRFAITPEVSPRTALLTLGVEPARSTKLQNFTNDQQREQFAERLAGMGLVGVRAGMTLEAVGVEGQLAQPAASAADVVKAARRSEGKPLTLEFVDAAGQRVSSVVPVRLALQAALVKLPGGTEAAVDHLLGLMPLLKVDGTNERGAKQGLKSGDVFLRVGAIEYPSLSQGISEIRAHKGKSLDVVVLRDGQELALKVAVSGEGTIGFGPDDTSSESTLVALPPASLRGFERALDRSATAGASTPATSSASSGFEPPARRVIRYAGTSIDEVGGVRVTNFDELARALREQTRQAAQANQGADVELTLSLPLPPDAQGTRPVERVRWELSGAEVASLHALAWQSPLSLAAFELEETVLRASGPLGAVELGLAETHRVMMTTYLTFLRLFQGTVRVEHLKGPVGIAHLGTIIASRGFIWLLFFLALISVNLAVINFLPLPIVDGGQFIFLVIEQLSGKPVPLAVQNAAALAGMLLIGTMFLVVTFNDITNLLGL